MMTWPQIIKLTPKDRQRLATTVKILKAKKGYDEQGRYILAAVTHSTEDALGRRIPSSQVVKYVSTVTYLDKKNHVLLSCSCPDFMYRFEVALNKKGAAVIEYSNGKRPRITNSEEVPGACIAEGSMVQTDSGMKPIELITNEDRVLTLHGYSPVAKQWCTGVKDTLQLTSKTGRVLECTPDHRVYAVKVGDIQPRWHNAGDLSEGDYLVSLLPEVKPPRKKDSYRPLAIVLGYVVSEADEWAYGPMEKCSQKDFSKHYKAAFGEKFEFTTSTLKFSEAQKQKFTDLGIQFGNRTQRVPGWIFGADLETRVGFVYGLWMGDGWISRDGAFSTYASCHEELAKDVQLLLLTLGIHSTITYNVSGVSDTDMYLVRPTTSSTQKLIRLLPKLVKYNYVPRKYKAVSSVEDRFPIYVPDGKLVETLRQMHYESVSADFSVSEKIVPIVSWSNSRGFNGWSIVRYMNRNPADFTSMIKRRINGADRPSGFASINDIGRALATLSKSKIQAEIPRLYPSDEGCDFACKSGFTRWLSRIPDTLSTVKRFYSRLLQSDVIFEEIASINTNRAKVYDIEVDGPPHFTANGFVVHNCKHLVAMYFAFRSVRPDA